MDDLDFIERHKDLLNEKRNEKEFVINFIDKNFKYEINLYNFLLDETVKMIKSMKSFNELEYSILISYLINNGYLSNKLSLKRQSPKVDYIGNFGINIVKGEAMCRHFSQMHKDLFNKLQLYSEMFYCVLYKGLIFYSSDKYFSNHSANIIEYNKDLYVIDIMNNNRLFYFIDNYYLREIKSECSNFKIRYTPIFDCVLNNKNVDEIRLQLEKHKTYNTRIISDEYKKIKYDTLMYLNKNRNIFIDFHNETSQLKNEINDSLVRKEKILIRELSK